MKHKIFLFVPITFPKLPSDSERPGYVILHLHDPVIRQTQEKTCTFAFCSPMAAAAESVAALDDHRVKFGLICEACVSSTETIFICYEITTPKR